MPAVQYPFIDIAVHPRIRERFARGEAMALFSIGLDRVLWANGAGANLFGYSAIYDFIEQGAKQGDVSFRQVTSTAQQLTAVGDTRSFLIRVAVGFQRVVVNATVEMVRIQAGEQAILFSCPVSSKEMDTSARAQRMLEGFDDPDTHMAVMGRDGEIIASSAGFRALGITPHTASMLVTMAGTQPERLIKRPIPTGQGYLPAAIGRLSEDPALHLLFVVEMVIGHLDPVDHATPAPVAEAAVPAAVITEGASEPAVKEADARPVEVEEAPAVQHHTIATDAESEQAAPQAEAGAGPQPELEAHGDQPDMLAAISAASLPAEANAKTDDRASEPTPSPATERLETETAETLAAISAAELPHVTAALDAPVEQDSVEDAAPISASSEPESLLDRVVADPSHAASVEDSHSDWATSDIPPLTGSEIAGFAHALEPDVAGDESGASTVEDAETAHGFEEHVEADLPTAGFPKEAVGTIEPIAAAEELPETVDEFMQADGTDSTATEDMARAPDTNRATDSGFSAVIDAVSEIEDLDDEPDEIAVEDQDAATETAQRALDEANIVAPADEQSIATEHSFEADALPASPEHEADNTLSKEPQVPAADGQESAPIDADIQAPAQPEIDPHAEEALAEPVAAYEPAENGIAAAAEHAVGVASSEILPATEELVSSPAETVPAQDPSATHFVFNRNGRATRFVWKIDAEGRFSEISREFAEAVGPHATSVTGVAFADIAALFNLDPDGKIAELLAKRDTWSGRTIHWPVEGTTLTVPVDLAALPTYTRGREFDGFRGFGVVRLSDATDDPMKIGLTLTADSVPEPDEEPATHHQEAVAPLPETPAVDNHALPESEYVESTEAAEAVEAVDAVPEETSTQETAAAADEPELPFHSEPPALRIVENPARRLSDKIIQLHEHRLATSDTLSPSEQAAFREIGKQLQPFGKRTEPTVEPTEQVETAEHDAGLPSTPDVDEGSSEAAGTDVHDHFEAWENDASEPLDPEMAAGSNAEEFDPLSVLNTAIPPRSKMTDGLSADAIDQLPVAILVHAGDTLMHANPEFLRLTGYESLAEIEGVGGLEALLQRHDLQEKAERPGTMVLVRADDALVPVTARLQSIRWEDSSALLLALMPVEKVDSTAADSEARDEVRPERMLEKVAKLQVEVEELQSILETATDGVAIIGPEGDIRSMNRSASALFNYDEQETRGKPFIMLFAHESQKAVLDYLSGLSGNGVASLLNDGREVIGREASGGFVPLFMTMGVLTSSNGYCAVIRDITQWKRTEEELRNAKRAAETANAHKTDFLARVSHEIRTPLNAIVGFSDMMASERLGPIGHPRYVEYAGDIGRSGRHVLDIVNDLLDISKIEAGEMDLEFGSVGLNAAISEAVSIVQPQANGQRVIIRTALSQSVPNVVADLRSIKQIALNILANAIRFTPSGGQIVVSTSYEGNGSVIMRIRDTGVGMTRTELEQAMKPFRQVTTNSRQRGEGTGLGLPLTKAMVDANRALFAIHSAPNEGTLVEITFPSPRVLAN